MSFVSWMNGTVGRVLRMALGVALVVVGLLLGGAVGIVLAVVGLVPLAAGALGVCLVAPALHASPRTR